MLSLSLQLNFQMSTIFIFSHHFFPHGFWAMNIFIQILDEDTLFFFSSLSYMIDYLAYFLEIYQFKYLLKILISN